MKTDEQIITLLEFLGWERGVVTTQESAFYGTPMGTVMWRHPDNRDEDSVSEPPPLTLDLLHEAAKGLDRFQQELRAVHLYCILVGKSFDQLKSETGGGQRFSLTAWMASCLLNATKEQHLEALLKTIGRWTDGESK